MSMPLAQAGIIRATPRLALAAALAAGLALPGGGTAAQTARADQTSGAAQGWEFQLTPLAQVGSVEGVTELGRAGGGMSIDPGGVLDPLRAGGVLEFEARHHSRLGFRLRYTVQDADGRGGGAAADYDQNIGEAVVTYQLGRRGADAERRGRLELFGGLRHWDVDVQSGGLQSSAEWTDPIAGLRWQRRLSPRLSLLLEGDVAGFGDSAQSWSAAGGLIYDRWPRASVYVMYRGLGVEYERGRRGTAGHFRHDTVTHGLLAGVGFRF